MGRLIRIEELVPDVILCSTAVRARQTAELVAEASGFSGTIELLETYYLADPPGYLAEIAALNEGIRSTMIVGHNPGLEELVELLTGVQVVLPTAALARIESPVVTWNRIGVEQNNRLLAIWRPRELECI